MLTVSGCLRSLQARCKTQWHADRTRCSVGRQSPHDLIPLAPGTQEPLLIRSPAAPGTSSTAPQPQDGAHQPLCGCRAGRCPRARVWAGPGTVQRLRANLGEYCTLSILEQVFSTSAFANPPYLNALHFKKSYKV